MIIDSRESTIISSVGWVDRGVLWCLDVATGRHRVISLSDAKYLSLRRGRDDLFAVVHHFDGARVDITAHSFAEPDEALSRWSITGDRREITGDASVWARLPQHYVGYLKTPSWSEFALITIEPETASIQSFDWYDEHYDKVYQGIVGVNDVPGSKLVIVSVQRDSNPVLYDPVARRKVGSIALAGSLGNPTFYFRRTAGELWAVDYDTLLKLEVDTWRVVESARLQDTHHGSGQFLGEFTFDTDEGLCAVARPFGGDVVGVDPDTLRIHSRSDLGRQPLEVSVLSDRRVFARDWKSGDFLSGQLEPVSGR